MKTFTSIVLALAVAVPAVAQQQVDETHAAAGDGVVSVSVLSGSVTVRGWARNEVHVKGTLERGVERLRFDSSGRHTRIETVIPDDCHRCAVDLVIQVPAASRLEVRTISASVEAAALTGTLDAQTVSGGIRAADNLSGLRAETVSGAVDLETGTTPVDARSVSGSITMHVRAATIAATTVSGRLDVEAGALERGTFHSVSGAIRLAVGVSPQGRIDVESVNGAVTLALPPSIAADFHVSTFSGSIDNAFGPNGERTSDFVPGTELTFSTGGGGGRIGVQTFSGLVRLVKR